MNERRQLLQDALLTIERLEARLAATERPASEPLAVIGVGCRYPGEVKSLEDMWKLLVEERDAVGPYPEERWEATALFNHEPSFRAKLARMRGGFLRNLDAFDPQFFGISPREAATLDPQQRLLLETATEALETAAIPWDRLTNSMTAVYVGITANDFASMLRGVQSEECDLYSSTGGALNTAGGRISFTYGFRGPCTALDTACSSSLLAVHFACQSLRARECDLALAGGVNLALLPDSMIHFTRWGLLGAGGACRAFDASADGFVRGEGCGMIAIRRLADAQAAGDPIFAIIRSTAANSDGRSSGFTVPSGPAQQAVVTAALKSAQLEPKDVDYVEAHGTGTSLGDPIEVEALGAALGSGRAADRPLLIGSVKTNLGHTESASGVAGLIKILASLRNEAIPATIHLKTPNPGIPWDTLPIKVPTKLTPWKRSERPRRAGVSSFGLSGTNVHAIVEEPPPEPPPTPVAGGTSFVVPLSGRDDDAIRALAQRYADFLGAKPTTSLADVATTLTVGRAHMPRRVALVTESIADLERDLRAIAAGEIPPTAHESGPRPGDAPKIGFLFSGQGSQYPGMGRGLYETEPVFKASIDRATEVLSKTLPRPLTEILFPEDPTSAAAARIGETAFTQPALFALEVALAELWASWGITPSIVIGHSVGEYAAACVAGAFSFEDGLALIAERGRLMQALPAGGGMAAIMLPEAQVAPRVADQRSKLAIGAVNGPNETVVSGDLDALDALVASFAAEGVKTRKLDVSHAFHSHRLDPMLDALEKRAASVTQTTPKIPLVSNLTGQPWALGTKPDASYWRKHSREAVRFGAGIGALKAAGVSVLVEIGPQATLLSLAERALPGTGWKTVASLRKDRVARREILSALAGVYARGAAVKWEALASGRRIVLPTYPFRRDHHWPNEMVGFEVKQAQRSRRTASTGHPLLGEKQPSPAPGAQFLGTITREEPAFVADHIVLGKTILPGTAHVEIGLAAGRALRLDPVDVEALAVEAPLPLDGGGRMVHVQVEPEVGGRCAFIVRSASEDDGGAGLETTWVTHARGQLRRRAKGALPTSKVGSVAEVEARCQRPVDIEAFYRGIADIGLPYGPTFRLVRSAKGGTGEAAGTIQAPPDSASCILHPALLDATFHLLGATFSEGITAPDGKKSLFLPVGIERVVVREGAAPSGLIRAAAQIHEVKGDPGVRTADVRLEDAAGNLVATITGLQLRSVTVESLERALASSSITTHTFRVKWAPLEAPGKPAKPTGRVAVVGDRGGFGAALTQALADSGIDARLAAADSIANGVADAAWVVDCGALDAPTAGENTLESATAAYAHALAVVKAAPHAGYALVTRGAQAIAPGDDVDASRAALLGLARTAAAEHAQGKGFRVDLDPSAPPDARTVARAFVGFAETEPEMGIRAGAFFGARVAEPSAHARRSPTEREVLRVSQRGSIDNLGIERMPRTAPGPGQVEIELRGAGLNFRDVLNALGMYPGDPGPLGSEAAGVVSAVGPDVTDLKVGDEVMGFVVDCFGTHAIAQAGGLMRKPVNLGFPEAAALPTTYLTSAYAFRVGALKPGQKILVHAAAGGVGIAATRLARRMGAIVYGTASSLEKRAVAMNAGATAVFDSRSTSFADDIMKATNGEGVDFVLNSLSGDLITASMRVLKPGGSFIEIGKNNIWTPAEAAERAPHARYWVIDLGDDLRGNLPAVRKDFQQLLDDIESGALVALPVRTFPLGEAQSAFRFMAAAKHIGKLVLVPDWEPADAKMTMKKDGTYLVTGGLGGLGLTTASFLAERGAGDIVLTGRRGATASDEPKLAAIRAKGARVTAVACDVADRAAVGKLFDEVLAKLPPLRGVVHSAGVIDDGMLGQQTPARFDTTANGKVGGALHLSEAATRARAPLDFFVMYSSASARLGSPGQANYAASNAFLDGFAAHLRVRGKVATSIGWGAWDEVGMAAPLAGVHAKRWAEHGVGMLEPKAAVLAMDRAVAHGDAYVTIGAYDPSKLVATGGSAIRALFAAAAPAAPGADRAAPKAETAGATDIGARLRKAAGDERRTLLAKYVQNQAARVLGFNAAALDAETPLSTLGFDSLMAVQLKNRVEGDLAIEIPLGQFLASPTVTKLIDEISSRLTADDGATGAKEAATFEEGSL